MKPTETKETIRNKENSKMLFFDILFLFCFSLFVKRIMRIGYQIVTALY